MLSSGLCSYGVIQSFECMEELSQVSRLYVCILEGFVNISC